MRGEERRRCKVVPTRETRDQIISQGFRRLSDRVDAGQIETLHLSLVKQLQPFGTPNIKYRVVSEHFV